MSAEDKPTNIIVDNKNLIQMVLRKISSFCEEGKNLMISVFDVKEKKFLYCNKSYKTILGYNSKEIMGGGWNFWYKKISPNEAGNIKKKIEYLIHKPHILRHSVGTAFNYHIKDKNSKWYYISHELALHQLKKNLIILNYIYDISEQEQIEFFFTEQEQFPINGENGINISKREKEVLILISEGFSSKEIASELYISNHTAIAHRKNLIQKFKVKNTAQLIKVAAKSILI